MVLVGAPRQVPVTFNQPALRLDDAPVLTQMAPPTAARRRRAAAVPRRSRRRASRSSPRRRPTGR